LPATLTRPLLAKMDVKGGSRYGPRPEFPAFAIADCFTRAHSE
jgi:hypothetical protein